MNASTSMKAIKNLQQLFKGAGFVSLTAMAKELNVDRSEIEALAAKMNLKVSAQGRFGICATK